MWRNFYLISSSYFCSLANPKNRTNHKFYLCNNGVDFSFDPLSRSTEKCKCCQSINKYDNQKSTNIKRKGDDERITFNHFRICFVVVMPDMHQGKEKEWNKIHRIFILFFIFF